MRKHMLFFVFMSVFGQTSWCMEAKLPVEPAEKKPQGSLKIKIRLPKAVPAQPLLRTSAELLQQNLVAHVAHFEQAQESDHIRQEAELMNSLQEDDPLLLIEEYSLPRLGSWLDDCVDSWFDTAPTEGLYLVHFDAQLLRYLSFCASTQKKLIGMYLSYLLTASTNQKMQDIHTLLQEKFPVAGIQHVDGKYILKCRVQECGYVESQLSVDQLKVKIFLHDMLYHQRDSEWYCRISGRIRNSFEDALQALKDGSK